MDWLQDKFKLDLSLVSQLGARNAPCAPRPPSNPRNPTTLFHTRSLLWFEKKDKTRDRNDLETYDPKRTNPNAFSPFVTPFPTPGGHSYPRTHRGKERFPGFTITYALMEALEKVMEGTDGELAKIVTKAEAKKLLTDAHGAVVGVEYVKGGETHKAMGPVVIATGGYGADYTGSSLLARHRPELQSLPTTNGDHCTGDGIKMAEAIGAGTVDMTSVQVHPTGLVNPSEPEAKVKFLAAEALRGVGGVLLDGNGKRFCDELGRRDYVSGEMNKGKGPFRLILNGKASKEIEWHCKHYVGRGIMKRFNSGEEVAREIGVSPSTLAQTFADYNRAAQTQSCPYGKKFFHNLPLEMNDTTFHVAIVTTVVHYTMGGLAINAESQVVNDRGIPVVGLYATGEVAGGIHGRNRLGGNSLLDCVVFGRVAGDSVSKHLLSSALKTLRAGGPLSTDAALNRVSNIHAHVNPNMRIAVEPMEGGKQGVHINVQLDAAGGGGGGGGAMFSPPAAAVNHGAARPAPPPMAAKAPAPGGGGGARTFTEDEITKHNAEGDCWCIIEGKVYDLTSFLPDHPGGKKAIMLFAGKDATEEFNMLHPPNVIKKYLPPEALLGTVA